MSIRPGGLPSMARGGASSFRQKPFARPASFRPGFYREEQLIVARDEHRGRTAETRPGDRRRTHAFADSRSRRLPDTAAIAVIPLLFLASFGTAAAQDEGVLVPPPITAPPAPLPPLIEEEEAVEEAEEEPEEEEEELRRALPFVLPEPTLTERLLPDARPELNTEVLFPRNALEGLRPRGRGLRVGRFAVSSSVDVAATYDDNIRASDDDRDDDITGNIGGSVGAESQFERHSLGFNAGASIGNPHDDLDQDTIDRLSLAAGVDGRLDLTRRSSLSAEANFARGAQNPEEEEAGAEEQPTIITGSGAVAYAQRYNRLGWELASGVHRREADDGDEASEQDRTSYTISPGVDYRLSRRLTLFADTAYGINNYDQSGEGGSRDSQTIRADVGTEIALGRTFSARLGAGYAGVFFDDSERDDRHIPTLTASLGGAFGVSLDRLTLLRLGIAHSTDQTTDDEAALVTRTGVFAAINRPLTRASAILGRVDLNRSDFVDDDRTDHNVGAEVAYSYDLLQNVALNLSYRFSRRFSDESEDEFYRNLVSVGLSATF
jgi:hypothetical protein